jgi:hypothetical protein
LIRRELVNKNNGKNEQKQKPKRKLTKKLILTPLTPSYGHMSSACEWEISSEGDSGTGTRHRATKVTIRDNGDDGDD